MNSNKNTLQRSSEPTTDCSINQSKRQFIETVAKAGAGIVGATVLAACGGGTSTTTDAGLGSNPNAGSIQEGGHASLPRNILVILTDQERSHMHWPDGWAAQNLPSMQRLMQNGLTFSNAYTAAGQCSPSRAVMMSGQFSAVNTVPVTFNQPGLPAGSQLSTLGGLLATKTNMLPVWKGKWHLAFPLADGPSATSNTDSSEFPDLWTAADIDNLENKYGWSGWLLPDAGVYVPGPVLERLKTCGGGISNNDGRFVSGVTNTSEYDVTLSTANGPVAANLTQTPGVSGGTTQSVVDFLTNTAPTLSQPFCLVVALVNPHDVGAYPNAYASAGYNYQQFANLGIQPPPSFSEDLSSKPTVQQVYLENCIKNFGDSITTQQASDYVNFYAYLHKVVDAQITTILNALDSAGLTDDTLIIRTADHGEAGLSHGGMTEKDYTAYEEMIHIPLVISNPKVFPEAHTTDAFYDHLNFLPTILDLAGVSEPNSYGNSIGQSVVPIILNPLTSVRNNALYAYDDEFGITSNPTTPAHIRAIRQDTWMYSVYFDPASTPDALEYELYDLTTDPNQTNNLLGGMSGAATALNATVLAQWQLLHKNLTQQFLVAGQLGQQYVSFEWPVAPWTIS
jgi:choline-sulfatase